MGKEKFCLQCQTISKPKKKTPGSIWAEVFLWCLFIFPGLLYSLWRISNKKPMCRDCGSLNLVSPQSPVAKKLLIS